MKKYEAVIGLEIHAELKTETKMFCGCKNETFSIDDKQYAISTKPNTNVCPVCLGMPGTLPVMNRQAVEWTILTGLALNCKVNKFTKWDRKNYFYPDLPKGYQISQYDLPIVEKGYLEVTNGYEELQKGYKKIGITRIHLEEDTGTLKHPEGRVDVDYSLADYNRAGVPLMELVTDPDLRSAKEAKEFCQKYQQILRTLKIADADMEKGQMRCEANISIRKIGDKKFGTKVEIKNLNSFKSVEKAIKYEIERQSEALESGEKIIQQTRGWDEKNQKTYVMRTKETSADYRYFPEPDLPPATITNEEIEKIQKQLPELPEGKIKRYVEEYKIKREDAEVIAGNQEKAKYFESCIKYNVSSIMRLANYIINEIPDLSIRPEHLVELVNLIEGGKISGKIAKEILPEIKKGKSPVVVVRNKGLEVLSDDKKIAKIIDKIIAENPEVVAKIKSGQTGVMGFLMGQVMSATKGKANPQLVNQILRKKLF